MTESEMNVKLYEKRGGRLDFIDGVAYHYPAYCGQPREERILQNHFANTPEGLWARRAAFESLTWEQKVNLLSGYEMDTVALAQFLFDPSLALALYRTPCK